MPAPTELLEPPEIALLRRALGEWIGPARCSDELAFAMGFTDAEDLRTRRQQLDSALADDLPLSSADWARVLVASEIVFVSDLFGSGYEWRTTTGLDDETTIRTLRSIQRKLGPTLRPHYFKRPSE
ncbi:hypothetical protein [Streptomyces sp. TLI_171]|uniref:hypothetical protein n=1 Tax=Streptomyces sp. TLI_171 TaxID=1938859 RepID=UPI000C1A18AC|nr:hypothetical protein [Streptomyces sp. TLI_171]RKE17079.1 hypothetical protein BX266_0330 [Streptomyces sp. TLI_171]